MKRTIIPKVPFYGPVPVEQSFPLLPASESLPLVEVKTSKITDRYRITKMNYMDIGKEISDLLLKEISYEIDQEIIRDLNHPTISALRRALLQMKKQLHGHVDNSVFEHTLSFKRNLGGDINDWQKTHKATWEDRLPRYRPVSVWSFRIKDDHTDVIFSFVEEEDRVAFLLLMR